MTNHKKENQDNALDISEKDYEIGTLEEAQKFSDNRKADLGKFPVTYSTSEKKFTNP